MKKKSKCNGKEDSQVKRRKSKKIIMEERKRLRWRANCLK